MNIRTGLLSALPTPTWETAVVVVAVFAAACAQAGEDRVQ